MKNLLLIVSCIIATIPSYAQITSKLISQDSILYLIPAQEAFMIDKETKSMFKTGPLAYERKVSESFSINLQVEPFIEIDLSDNNINLYEVNANLEIRNYWKLPKLIKEGKQANNLSSTYWGAGVGYGTGISGGTFGSKKRKSIFAVLGDQKRFLNYGYIDYGLKLEYAQTTDPIFSRFFNYDGPLNGFTFSTYTNVGFVLAKRYSLEEGIKCPIFKCHLDRSSALKLNYNKVFGIYFGDILWNDESNVFSMNLNPNISYEHKIGNSSFSLEHEVDVRLSLSSASGMDFDKFGVPSFGLEYSIGSRYYISLKKNMRQGKSGNNLSGVYTLARSTYRYSFSEYFTGNIENPSLNNSIGSYLDLDVGVGYQKTVLDDIFFDIQLYLPVRLTTFKMASNPMDSRDVLKFKVGKFF